MGGCAVSSVTNSAEKKGIHHKTACVFDEETDQAASVIQDQGEL
jgi:hypothetical protein